jgi:transposase InsO family protein
VIRHDGDEPPVAGAAALCDQADARSREVHREDVRRSALDEVKVMIEDFRQDYNRCRPHRAHGMMTPAAFRTGWLTAHEAAPASAGHRSL